MVLQKCTALSTSGICTIFSPSYLYQHPSLTIRRKTEDESVSGRARRTQQLSNTHSGM